MMNRSGLYLVLIAVFSATWLLGCGPDETASNACKKDADCAGEFICVDTVCVQPDVTDVGDEDDATDDTDGGEIPVACTNDEQCGASQCVAQGDSCVRPSCDTENETCTTTDCTPICDEGYSLVGCECVRVLHCGNELECPPDQLCNDDNVCAKRPQCTLDADCKGENQQCLAGRCTLTSECEPGSDTCGNFAECIGGKCHALLCRGQQDCAENEVCDSGECVVPQISEKCTIVTRGGTIAPNQRIRLEAFAYDAQGQGIATRFVWKSSVPGVAELDETTLVGGTTAGTSVVTARAKSSRGDGDGTAIDCEGSIQFTNVGLVQQNGLRILVAHGENQLPIAGAQVVVNGGQPVITDATGLAAFPIPSGAFEVSVFSDDYNYVTIQGVSARDLRIPLTPRRGSGKVAGFTGAFDASNITTRGEVTLGLAGASISGGLLDVDLTRLLGETFVTQLSIPGMGGGSVPLPGGVVAYGGLGGFQLDIKKEYYVNTADGARVGWGLAGKVPFQQLMGLFQGGGTGSIAEVLTTVLPLFSRFEHAAKPLHLSEFSRVVDSTDINGNGNRTELVPDYANFPRVSIAPKIRQTLASEILISNFPQLAGGSAEAAVLVGGAMLDAPGLIPLGISATADENNDGRPDARMLYMAPPHGSATGGRFSVMAIAFSGNSFGGGGGDAMELASEFSVALWNGESLPTSIRLGTFPDASQGQVNNSRREVQFTTNAGPVYRVRMIGEERTWDIWAMGAPGSAAEFTHTMKVPTAPANRQDLFANSTIMLDAIRSSVTLDDLVRSTGVGLRNAGLVSTSYNRTRLR